VLGYDVAPEGGRLVVNPAEAEQVRGIFSVCAACSTMTEALRAVRARRWTAKQWTSERGKQHGGQPLSMSTLKLLLTNVLYRGDISYKGTVYPGEHEAIVPRELWVEVNGNLRLSRTVTRSHVKVESLLENLLACAHCGSLLRTSFTRCQGRRHVYYVCRAGKKQHPGCPQAPVACLDLDRSLHERLERMRGALPDAVAIQQLLQCVTYDSVSRRVFRRTAGRKPLRIPAADSGSCRCAADRTGAEARRTNTARESPRGLAIKFQSLVSSGSVRNYRELAEVGHVSRPRLSQIMKLAQLAPEIQEELLFLPPSTDDLGMNPRRTRIT